MRHPLRIQRKRTKGFRLPAGTICVNRPTKFGNPFIGEGAAAAKPVPYLGWDVDSMLRSTGEVLENTRFNFTTEAELQAGVAQALTQSGITFEREKRLDEKNRLDFFFPITPDIGIALETKIAGSVAEVTRQIHRYAQLEQVKAIIVLSRRSNVRDIPAEINGKPIRIITLESQGL